MSATSSGDVSIQLLATDCGLSVESHQHSKESGFDSPKCGTKFNNISTKVPKRIKHKRRLDRKARWLCSLNDSAIQRKGRPGFVLPKRFLLGGTITDPLNLSGLSKDFESQSTEFGHSTACDHKLIVSQYPAANVTDPLNLNEDLTDSSEHVAFQGNKQLVCRNEEECSGKDAGEKRQIEMELADLAKDSELANVNDSKELISVSEEERADRNADELKQMVSGEEICSNNIETACVFQSRNKYGRLPIRNHKVTNKDRIVSPAVPQSCHKHRKCSFQKKKPEKMFSTDSASLVVPSKMKSKKFSEKYSSGNYLAYYGYRNSTKSDDPRLKLLSCELFEGKDVLDVGCNAGFVTISIAQSFNPHRILGLDIDPRLIEAAKRNVRLFMSRDLVNRANYPKRMETLYGPASAGCLTASETNVSSQSSLFPHNIVFQVVCIF